MLYKLLLRITVSIPVWCDQEAWIIWLRTFCVVGFNSSMVRLGDFKVSFIEKITQCVSIPVWCDQEFQFTQAFTKSALQFQFQYGAIRR